MINIFYIRPVFKMYFKINELPTDAKYFFVVIKLMFIQVVTAQVIINEVSSSNKNILLGLNEHSDWIGNISTDTVNLDGYAISEDIKELDKYILPIIYCSWRISNNICLR